MATAVQKSSKKCARGAAEKPKRTRRRGRRREVVGKVRTKAKHVAKPQKTGEVTQEDRLIQSWMWGKADPTKEVYLRQIKRFRAFIGLPMAEVSRTDVISYLEMLKGRGLAPSSLNQAIGSLRSWFDFLVDEEVIERSPARVCDRLGGL